MEAKVVKLGHGKIAIVGGLQLPDESTVVGLLMLEEDKGSGTIAMPVPDRKKGQLVFLDNVQGVILEFSDPRSIDVVIKQLSTLRCDWNRVLSDEKFRQELQDKSNAAIEARNA